MFDAATTKHIEIVARELSLAFKQVANTAKLIAEGATVPFISRYRKELTGSLDEVVISAIRERLAKLEEQPAQEPFSQPSRPGATDEYLPHRGVFRPVELEDIYYPTSPNAAPGHHSQERGLEPWPKY